MPTKILIYVKDGLTNPSYAVPDRYCRIDNANITFDNGQPQLSAATTNQLYDISVRNGLSMPRDCFTQQNLQPLSSTPVFGCGSVLIVDPALDLGIREGISDNSPGRYVFQVNLTVSNNTTDNFNSPSLVVIALNDAILERNGAEYRNYLLSLPYDAFQKTRDITPISSEELEQIKEANMFLSGGSLWSWLKNAGKWIWHHKGDIVKVAKAAAPLVGLGMHEREERRRFEEEMENREAMRNMGHRKRLELPSQQGTCFNEGRHPRKMDLFYQ